MGIEVRWGAASHQGTVREQNEDAVLAGPAVFAVADGMGGHAGGEVASATAVALLSSVLDNEVTMQQVEYLLAAANDEILKKARVGDGPAGMGTTVAGLALGESGSATIFNLGDSRVYRIRAHELDQLTADHSVVGELVRSGELSAEAARSHPDRNIVTKALGLVAEIEPQLMTVVLEEGDRFLICSDGLTDELDDLALSASSEGYDDVVRLAQHLIEEALDAGGRDNVSAVVVEVVKVSSDDLDRDTDPLAGSMNRTTREHPRADDLEDDTNPTPSTVARLGAAA